MSFRTVVITKQCKCSYKNGFLVVRDETTKTIHLTEIYCLIIDTTAVTVTAYLMNELAQKKIPIIFCDEQHIPSCESFPIYGNYNTSKRVLEQMNWEDEYKIQAWTMIVAEKIKNQAKHLQEINNKNYEKILDYYNQVEFNDATNREGHSAKVYFNSLFGKDFCRNDDNYINAALDYGYSILLSAFVKEIVAYGCITQIGICHRNEFNQFNLACDLMEPFRPIVDRYVFSKIPFVFDNAIKYDLINLLNISVKYQGSDYYLTSVISQYVKNVLSSITNKTVNDINFYELYEK